MNQLFMGITIVLGVMCYWLYNTNQALQAENAALEVAMQTQSETIDTLQNDMQVQTSALLEIQGKNQEIEAEMNRYLDIFKRHNLTKLAAAKPGLIEPKANKATKEVFDGIEEDSRNIDDLDDVGVQSDSK